MTKLIIMIVFCTAFAAISQRRKNNIRKNHLAENEYLFFIFLTCYMVIFAGLRTYFNDTTAYIRGFNNCAKFPGVFSDLEGTFGDNPGFQILMSLIKTFSNDKNVFLMISSAITLIPTIWFIRKYSKSFAFSIFLFFMFGYYTFTLAAIKQTMATAIALIALDRYMRGKKLSYFLYMLLAMTIHTYVLMYFITPILMKQVPWEKATWFLLLIVLAVSASFNFLIGTILNITDILGDSYDAENFVGEGINIFRVMVFFVPLLISFFWKKTLFRSSSDVDNLFVNFSIVCALIMFIGLFGNANMFSRLAIFFEPMIFISLPWMLEKLKVKSAGIVLTSGSYFAFPLFFYYQMVITIEFDYAYKSISLGQFINNILE